MTTPRYIIASSYFSRSRALDWFYRVWHENTFTISEAKAVIIAASAGCKEPKITWNWNKRKQRVQWIQLTGDIGWCDHLLKGEKNAFMPACCAAWLACAWLAYMDECDLLVKEQDCLWFGDFIKGLYNEIGDRKVLLGTSAMQGAATSIFLVKWDYIPQFVADYLSEGRQNHINRISETNLHRLCSRKPEEYGQFTFACGKDRPMPLFNTTFYVEKPTPAELTALADRGLVQIKGMPDTKVFSNHP